MLPKSRWMRWVWNVRETNISRASPSPKPGQDRHKGSTMSDPTPDEKGNGPESADPVSILNVLGEKVIHQHVNPQLLAYCPSMDLIAIGTREEQVFVYRLNGQRVLSASQKDAKLRVQKLKWKPNGLFLAG
jgi:hypothetical protein